MSLYMEEEGAVTLSFDTEETAKIVTEAALDYIGCPYEAEINLLLTTNDEIREMNRMFRQIDKPTDVLSFPMLEYETPGEFSGFEEQGERSVQSGIWRADARRHCDLQRKSIGTGRGVRAYSASRVCISDRTQYAAFIRL